MYKQPAKGGNIAILIELRKQKIKKESTITTTRRNHKMKKKMQTIVMYLGSGGKNEKSVFRFWRTE